MNEESSILVKLSNLDIQQENNKSISIKYIERIDYTDLYVCILNLFKLFKLFNMKFTMQNVSILLFPSYRM